MRVITSERVPIKIWTDEIEDGALQQAKDIANLPFSFKHIAIMPDTHQGYGMPIGGVLATKGVVVPNAVGVDIGCGMRAVKTNMADDVDLKSIMGKIRKLVPVGFDHHKTDQLWGEWDCAPDEKIVQEQLSSAKKQLGTLGGGNHFIEIQKGSDGHIWFMVHTGSRNFGYKIANYYHKVAQNLCEKWYSDIPNKDLAFLPIETKEAKDYLDAMNYALKFAKQNRHAIMSAVIKASGDYSIGQDIDIHHNYAAWENHYNQNVIIHRKGATLARGNTIGIIPGSQGTKSYIVKGKGNPESFYSCSHGAGRKMGRKQATRELDLESEIKRLDDQGIVHGIRNVKDLDEASGAYKDISEVMRNQEDLVEILVELQPLAVIKG